MALQIGDIKTITPKSIFQKMPSPKLVLEAKKAVELHALSFPFNDFDESFYDEPNKASLNSQGSDLRQQISE
jgi:hypothetical protein